jgi:nucleoid-associated protein YgaU
MKTQIVLLLSTALFIGCSSVSQSIPTVKIEKRKSKATVQSASYVAKSSPNQAAMICETDDKRRKVIDDNDNNDAVRLMVVEDGDTGSRVLSEVEIDCRDYFLRKSLAPTEPKLVRAVAPTSESRKIPRRSTRIQDNRFTYIVQSGDTVWDIARTHCTTAKAISNLNGLGRGNVIDIGQRLKLPDEACK